MSKKKDRMENGKKISNKKEKIQKMKRKKNEKDLTRKQRSSAKTEKKYQKHRVNSKEEIVTLSQMNILPFHKTTLQANDKSYLISFFMFSY